MKIIKTKTLLWIVMPVFVLAGFLIASYFFSYERKLEQLKKDLAEADSVEECEIISNEMADLWNSGGNCSVSFGEKICIEDHKSGRSELAECSGRLAAIQGDLNLCDNEKFDALKDKCLLSFLIYSDDKKTSSVNCNDFYGDSDKKTCFVYMAAIRDDFSYCNKLDSKCIRNVALDINDRELCKKIKNSNSKKCEDDFDSFSNKGFSACRRSIKDILLGRKNKDCIKDFAIFNNEPSLCSKIDNERDECLIFSR